MIPFEQRKYNPLNALQRATTFRKALPIFTAWLKRLRGQRTIAHVANGLRWNISSVCMLEEGQNLIKEDRARELDNYYQCNGGLFEAMKILRGLRMTERNKQRKAFEARGRFHEPTVEELETTIREQMKDLPDWWFGESVDKD